MTDLFQAYCTFGGKGDSLSQLFSPYHICPLGAHVDLQLIRDCMKHGLGFDAPGNLAHYLIDRTTIYAWQMPGNRFDIGSLDTYREAQVKFQ